MSVRDGTLRQRLLAGAMLCFAAAVPAVARAQQAPAGQKPAQAQQGAVAAPKAAPGQAGVAAAGKAVAQKGAPATPQKGVVAQTPAVPRQKPGVAAQKPGAAQAPAAVAQKPGAGPKVAAPVVAQKPGAAAKGAVPQKPVVAQKDAAHKPGKAKAGKAVARGGKRAPRTTGDEAERAVAAQPAPTPGEPTQTTHVVKPGDTLWDLSTAYLGSPWAWARVYNANRGTVQYPHWIYPGQKLNIPGKELLARLEQEEQQQEAPAREDDRTIFFRKAASNDTMSVSEDLRPAVERGEYLATPWVTDVASLGVIGSMLDRVKVEGRAEKLPQAVVIQDRIYVRPVPGTTPAAQGSELLLVRVGRALTPFGSIVEPTALVLIEGGNEHVAVGRIVKQYAPILQGQRALPVPAFRPPRAGHAQPVQRGPEGELIDFVHEQPLHTIADLGFVSIGRAEGLSIGDELVAYAPTRPAAADPKVLLPPEDVARLLVLRVEEHTATVRPLSMRLPSLQRGLKVRLAARVP